MCENSVFGELFLGLTSALNQPVEPPYTLIDFVVKANPDIRKCMTFGECTYIL